MTPERQAASGFEVHASPVPYLACRSSGVRQQKRRTA